MVEEKFLSGAKPWEESEEDAKRSRGGIRSPSCSRCVRTIPDFGAILEKKHSLDSKKISYKTVTDAKDCA